MIADLSNTVQALPRVRGNNGVTFREILVMPFLLITC